jgi:hypothetical protein
MNEAARHQLATPVAFAMLFAGALVHSIAPAARADDEPADAPLPAITARQLAEKIQEAWKGYEAGILEVTFDEEDEERIAEGARREAGEPTDRRIFTYQGRFQFSSIVRHWRCDFDSMTPGGRQRALVPDRWRSGFDGSRHHIWNARGNEVILGESDPRAAALTPRELFWPRSRDLMGMLAAEGTTIGQRSAGGVQCYAVEQDAGMWRTEYLVAPRQGFLATEMTSQHGGKPVQSYRLRGIERTIHGTWVPREITSEQMLGQFGYRRVARVALFDSGRAFTARHFAPDIPLNAAVTDRALGISYHNDPWWPEVGKLLRDRFDWPKPDLQWLKHVQSRGGEAIAGKDPPPIEASVWINSPPLDWATLRGKVVLLEFTMLGVRGDETPVIRRLAQHYRPAGLEVITVLESDDDPDEARQFIRELNIAHPVAVDRPHNNTFGATHTAFGIDGYLSTLLVDHTGKVHRIDAGQAMESVVRLLRGAGARDVEALPLEPPAFTREMIAAVDRSLQEWIRQAPTDGRIVGTIKDAQGGPIAGVRVRATLGTRILVRPSAYHLVSASERHSAVSAADGSFVMPGLCKGNYTLRFSAPGFAPVEREVAIGPDLGVATIPLSLIQGDSISGRVLDESGQPLAGAEARISGRRLLHPDGSETSHPGFLEMKRTDREGRFRFPSLEEGVYSLRFSADGFDPQTRDRVPAGTTSLDLTLRKLEPR